MFSSYFLKSKRMYHAYRLVNKCAVMHRCWTKMLIHDLAKIVSPLPHIAYVCLHISCNLFQVLLTQVNRVSGCNEYCWENFNATCPPNEVVVMQRAVYGRMKLGRCIVENYSMGCHYDVIEHMDRKCSGRHNCVVHIPDTDLQQATGCRRDLMAYLNASYECIPGKNRLHTRSVW